MEKAAVSTAKRDNVFALKIETQTDDFRDSMDEFVVVFPTWII